MKIRLRRILCALLCMLFVIQCGCGTNNDSQSSKDKKEKNNMLEIDMYYTDANWEDYVIEKFSIDRLSSDEIIIDSVMMKLLDTDGSRGAYSPVPQGMAYQRYTYDGHGLVSIIFNMDYESLSSYNAIMCKSAFTNTLCQIEAVKNVSFEMVNLIDEKDVRQEVYNSKDFTRLTNVLDSKCNASIYYPNSSGTALVANQVELDMSLKETLEQQLITKLINAADAGYASPFANKSVINRVYVEDGICTIDVKEKFLKGRKNIDNSIVVYSIVNSLCSISYIDGVTFTMDNGNAEGLKIGDFDLIGVYRSNTSYMQR